MFCLHQVNPHRQLSVGTRHIRLHTTKKLNFFLMTLKRESQGSKSPSKSRCAHIFFFVFVFFKFLFLFSSYTFGPAEVSYSPIRRSIYDTRISPSRLCRSARPRGLISYSSARFNHPGAAIIRQTLTQSKPRPPNTQTICISQVDPSVELN